MRIFIIEETLEAVRTHIEERLQAILPRDETWVKLANVVDNSGTPNPEAANSVVMFLANITRENIVSTYQPAIPASDGEGYIAVTPPLYIVLYVAFYANFENKNYQTGLKLISAVLSHFQQYPRFSPQSLPSLDTSIQQLTFELVSLDTTDLNYLMGLFGTKYLPTTMYKVRLLRIDEKTAQAQIPAASDYQVPSAPSDPDGQ